MATQSQLDLPPGVYERTPLRVAPQTVHATTNRYYGDPPALLRAVAKLTLIGQPLSMKGTHLIADYWPENDGLFFVRSVDRNETHEHGSVYVHQIECTGPVSGPVEGIREQDTLDMEASERE